MPTNSFTSMDIVMRSIPRANEFLPNVPDVRTLQGLLDQLEAAEREGLDAFNKLLTGRRLGYAVPIDFVVYTKLQDELFRAQVSVLNLVRALAGPIAGSALYLALPVPSPLPSVPRSKTGVVGLRGLGFLPIVAGILAVLAALGLMYLLSDEIEDIVHNLTSVLLARARAAQQTELLNARRVAYEACIARGGDGAACIEEAERLAPTPAQAGTEVPDAPGGGSGTPLSTFLWVGLGGVVLVALGYGAVSVMRARGGGYYRGGMYGFKNIPHRSPGKLPSRVADLDGSKSRYFLEV